MAFYDPFTHLVKAWVISDACNGCYRWARCLDQQIARVLHHCIWQSAMATLTALSGWSIVLEPAPEQRATCRSCQRSHLSCRDKVGGTPAHHAAYHGQLACLQWLVKTDRSIAYVQTQAVRALTATQASFSCRRRHTSPLCRSHWQP